MKVGGIGVALVLIVGVSFLLYGNGMGSPRSVSTPNSVGTTQVAASSSAQNTGVLSPALINEYYCAKPAINTGLFCDQLPPGFQIPGRSPNAPSVHCPSGMSASACNLLKQTMYTGVCTPNETPFTDPFDCGCSGATTADPYTGRCSAPSAVCQIGANAEHPQA
jgi:hypothetical protein